MTFIDLKKAFGDMDWGWCLEILKGYGVVPRMLRLIKKFWYLAVLVCSAKGCFGEPFRAWRGVTQGSPLLPKFFNILVNAVIWECLCQLEGKWDAIAGVWWACDAFTAIFYADDGQVASRHGDLLQDALDILAMLFECFG